MLACAQGSRQTGQQDSDWHQAVLSTHACSLAASVVLVGLATTLFAATTCSEFVDKL